MIAHYQSITPNVYTMKKILALSMFFVLAAFARTQAQTTGDVTLNVQLNAVQSITINPSFTTTTLTYSTADHYTNGVTTAEQTSAITVFSTTPYTVTVVANQDLTKEAVTIPVSNVEITPSMTLKPAEVTLTTQAISKTTPGTIITSTIGTLAHVFHLVYSTANSTKTDFLGKAAGTYTATLTFTLTAS